MNHYLTEVCRMEKFFDGFEVRYVQQLENWNVNHVVWISSSRVPTPLDVIVEKLPKPSVKAAESSKIVIGQDVMAIDKPEQEAVYDWMHPIISLSNIT
jgi:hypothetical protein